MTEKSEWFARASECRKLAAMASDAWVRYELLKLASQYEQLAESAPGSAPPDLTQSGSGI